MKEWSIATFVAVVVALGVFLWWAMTPVPYSKTKQAGAIEAMKNMAAQCKDGVQSTHFNTASDGSGIKVPSFDVNCQ